jgi:hypothetical protein
MLALTVKDLVHGDERRERIDYIDSDNENFWCAWR